MPYARFQAALHAGDLRFIRKHRASLSLSLADAAAVCRLVAEQEPAGLEAAAVAWIKRFAREARGEPRSDYALILSAFDVFSYDPETGADHLRALCAQRGLD